MIKKADVFLGVFIVIIGIFFTVLLGAESTRGGKLVIESGGKLYGEHSLDIDKEVTVLNGNRLNTINISNGKVQMTKASCPDQYCVKHKAIDSTNQTIVCLPNQVVITVNGSKEQEIDAITN